MVNDEDVQWLKDEAMKALITNRQTGTAEWCGYEYDFSCPSNVTYPFQWFWDSCFHVVALSHLDPEMAKREIRSLLANQHEDGFISHITFWQREKYEAEVDTYAVAFRNYRLTDEMQPPLLTQAISAIIEADPDMDFLAEVLPKVSRFYDWLNTVRVDPRDGLVRVFHPDETGLDHSPKFDALMRVEGPDLEDFSAAWYRLAAEYEVVDRDPVQMMNLGLFVVADVMTNIIYIENLQLLATLWRRLGDEVQAGTYEHRRGLAMEGLESMCWNDEDGLYYDIEGPNRQQVRVNTFTCLMPLFLADLPHDRAMRLIKHITDPDEYWTPFPIPSVAVNHPDFAPSTSGGILVWRGPTWVNSNWYLALGLLRHGRADLAEHVAVMTLEAIRRSGFREYYNPYTGEGHGAPGFGWSTVIVDLFVQLSRAQEGSSAV